MTPRRNLLLVIALFTMTVACTRPDATPNTEPLALPDTFSSSTTVTTVDRTDQPTTTIDTERAAIYPVDPLTLEAISGYAPITMGDWFWGMTSEKGSWLALNVGDDNGYNVELRLIDLATWETASTWDPVDQVVHVTDDGKVYIIENGPFTLQLRRANISQPQPDTIAELPIGFIYWSELHVFGEEQAALFGDSGGVAVIVTVDLATGVVTEIPMPGVSIGIVEQVDIGESYPGSVEARPAVVWDADRFRALIVHGNEDVVTEVDLTTGESTKHKFGQVAPDSGPLAPASDEMGAYVADTRSATLSGDGRSLHVATTSGEFEVTDDGWLATSSPTGIITIDTKTWQIVDHLEAPISQVHLSPDGARLLATGYGNTNGASTYEEESFGFYVIDPTGLEVIAHHGSDQPTRYCGSESFSRDGTIGYVTCWDTRTNIHVIDLATGDIIRTRSDPEIQIFGEVGILGEVQQGS
ncbi:MAG: hypothetical protein WD895_02125 [Acidimicrobiia bacterium]